jgi:2-polyprenyl-3-methyl-5-hydroxy-6-metoxy-1,4-benzoquinol methylase
MRVKVSLEGNYKQFERLIPKSASVLDLGCGYGFLCYMLSFTSELRVITGVDYDEEKIETARHGYSKTENLTFIHANIVEFSLAKYDVIIIADVLHYLTREDQEKLLGNCFKALNPGGRLIVRDGNSDLKERHKGTKLTEFFSVKLLKFNKSVNDLNFISGKMLEKLAKENGYEFCILDETKLTSNVIFVMDEKVNVQV